MAELKLIDTALLDEVSAEAKASLAGVPYEFWSLTLFALLALAALRVTLQPR